MAHENAQKILDSPTVFCPLHGWQAAVYGQPCEGYDGPTSPYTVVVNGGTARCDGAHNGAYCGRELVLGTFSACGECTLDEPLPGLPEDPSLARWEQRQVTAEREYRAQVLKEG